MVPPERERVVAPTDGGGKRRRKQGQRALRSRGAGQGETGRNAASMAPVPPVWNAVMAKKKR